MIEGVLYAHGLKNNFLFFIFKFIGIIAELLKTLIKNGMKSTSPGDTKKNRQDSKQTFALVLPSPHHKLLSLSSLPLGLFLGYKTAPCTVEKIKEEEVSKAPENSTDSTTHQTLYTNSVKSGGIQVTKQKV